MNSLNVGPWEVTLILIIAILLIGPKRMVEMARTIGRVTSQLRRFSNEFTSTLQTEITATEHEVMVEDPEDAVKSLTEPFTGLQAELEATGRETRQALENVVSGKSEPIESIQAELQATERETRQALENTIESDSEQEA